MDDRVGAGITAEARFKSTSTGTVVLLAQDGAFSIGLTGGKATAHYGTYSSSNNPEVTLTPSASFNDGNWHHAELDVGSGGGTLFIDGKIVASSTTTPATVQVSATANNGAIFRLTGTTAYNFAGEGDEFAIWSAERHTAAYTGSETGLLHLYHIDSNGTDSVAASGLAIAPNNAAGVYSPGNWNVTGTAATTINAGAYFSLLTSGITATLNSNVANNSAPLSEVEYRIDGFDAGRLGRVSTSPRLSPSRCRPALRLHPTTSSRCG